MAKKKTTRKKKPVRKAKPRKHRKKKTVRRAKPAKSFEKHFETRMEQFGQEMGLAGERFGKRIEKRGFRAENWWHQTFGFAGPFLSGILSIILIAVMVWVLNMVNLPFGNVFITNVATFLFFNLPLFFAISLFYSYSSYIKKWFNRVYVPVSPVIVAIGATIGAWLLMWALILINMSISVPYLTVISMFIQANLLGIFIVFLFLGYLGLIIWTMTGRLNVSEYGNEEVVEVTQKNAKEEVTETGVKRLYRSGNDRILGGVCGGIADYFQVDPVVIRLLWVAFTLVYGAGLLAYIIAWIIVPRNPKHKFD